MNNKERDYVDYLKKDDFLLRHDWFNLSDAQREYLSEVGSKGEPKVPYIQRDGQRYVLDESGLNTELNPLRYINLGMNRGHRLHIDRGHR